MTDGALAPSPLAGPPSGSVSRSALAIAALAWGVAFLPDVRGREEPRPNVVVIVTDDQSADSIPSPTPVMPYLQDRVLDPDDHWVVFERAFVNTPLCCPSRATMLTGRLSHDTNVLDNDDAERLDEGTTVRAWLHDDGYHTGLVGKYLNGYPFGRPPFVPEGWDRWWAKQHGPATNLYYDYTLIEQGLPVRYGSAEEDYATDVFASKAVEFIREAPLGRPFFLWFAPTAPHPPWTPAPQAFGDVPERLGADATVDRRGRRLGQALVGSRPSAGRCRHAGGLPGVPPQLVRGAPGGRRRDPGDRREPCTSATPWAAP